MKTIKNGNEIKRVTDSDGKDMTAKGWIYAKKSEWKKLVRDIGKKARVEKKAELAEVAEDKPKEKADRAPKSKGYMEYQAKKAAKKVKEEKAK